MNLVKAQLNDRSSGPESSDDKVFSRSMDLLKILYATSGWCYKRGIYLHLAQRSGLNLLISFLACFPPLVFICVLISFPPPPLLIGSVSLNLVQCMTRRNKVGNIEGVHITSGWFHRFLHLFLQCIDKWGNE